MNPFRSIPVGMYHHVNQHSNDFITVRVDHFESQMRMLAERGIQTLSATEFRECLSGTRSIPKRAVLLTFDDAWLDLYSHAFPILKHYGHRFTVFVVSEWTNRASEKTLNQVPSIFPTHGIAEQWVDGNRIHEVICGWSHLEEMMASGLCSIENHTATHQTHRYLKDRAQLTDEIGHCKEALQKHLGIDSRQLCWPRGRYSKLGLEVASSLGIEITYLVRRGVNLPIGSSLPIKRFTVDDVDGATMEEWIRLFSRPVMGYLYSRIKPDRLLQKWNKWRSK